MKGATDNQLDSGLRFEFKATADQITAYFKRYGISVVGYRSPELLLFFELSSETRTKVIHLLKEYLKCLLAAEENEDSFEDSNRSVWHAFRMLGLTPSHDLLSNLKPDALVEIYDISGFQIWRNIHFMKFCSYTLEEVYCLEWHRRYSRDARINEECFAAVQNVISGNSPAIYFPPMPEHVLEETSSSERLIFSAHYDVFAPLRARGRGIEAWLVMTSARIIGSRTEAYPPREAVLPIRESLPRPIELA